MTCFNKTNIRAYLDRPNAAYNVHKKSPWGFRANPDPNPRHFTWGWTEVHWVQLCPLDYLMQKICLFENEINIKGYLCLPVGFGRLSRLWIGSRGRKRCTRLQLGAQRFATRPEMARALLRARAACICAWTAGWSAYKNGHIWNLAKVIACIKKKMPGVKRTTDAETMIVAKLKGQSVKTRKSSWRLLWSDM